MVSPQPIATLLAVQHPASASVTSSSCARSATMPLAAPSPTMQASMQKSTKPATPKQAQMQMPRLKRAASFIHAPHEAQPYLWGLYDELPAKSLDQATGMGIGLQPDSPITPVASELYMEMPPIQYAFGEDLSHYASHPYAKIDQQECANCWHNQGQQCIDCATREHQFDHAWPMEPQLYDDSAFAPPTYLKKQDSFVMSDESHPYAMPPFAVQTVQQQQPQEAEQEEKTGGLPPLSAPLLTGSQLHLRVPGKLTRFLPEGQNMMQVDAIDPNYTTAFVRQAAHLAHATEARSMRGRKLTQRSRSPSPDLSERSTTPDSYSTTDSTYETDHYEHESEPAVEMFDDSLSPPVVRYEDSSSSGQSSAEPPAPTHLLPVSLKELLPSRPSTAAIPPAHIKDRLVKSAKKLLTAADGVNEAVQVQVIPIYYPSKQAAEAHKIRLVRVENTQDKTVSVYAHAADVGGVVERKSNISRLFGKFESPREKLLMRVPGSHNHTIGQESNILTSQGVRKFLATNKMKEEHAYRHWITSVLLPKLMHDPLEIGEELLEIEASTDPHAPHTFKPKKMRRMEKKQERKLQEKREEAKTAAAAAAAQATQSGLPSKRQKLIHSPTATSSFPYMQPFSMPPVAPFSLQQPLQPQFTPMNHAA